MTNGRAVLEGLFGRVTEFARTPKYRIEGAGDDWKQKRYRGQLGFGPFVELVLGLYFTAMAVYAAAYGIWGTLPFIVIFQVGFLYAAGMSLFQNVGRLEIPAELEA